MHRATAIFSPWFLCLCLLLSTGSAWSQVCGAPGKDGVAFARNTYFPGTGTAAAGSTTLNFGTARVDADASTTAFAVGDMALVIQMQDSSIDNTTNTGVYGDGVAGDPGSGSTSLRSSGLHEFKRVTSATGTSISFDVPLANTYTNANASVTDGNRRWQVVRVPQFASLTLPGGTIATTSWNGTTGGIFVLDVSGSLSMNNTTVTAAGVGFRGGGSQESTVISGAGVIDYASAQAAGTPPANRGGAKGEGIAGTPRFVRGATVTNGYTGINLGVSGYPNSLDLARGAPGNAGGGGTQHNSGGGVEAMPAVAVKRAPVLVFSAPPIRVVALILGRDFFRVAEMAHVMSAALAAWARHPRRCVCIWGAGAARVMPTITMTAL